MNKIKLHNVSKKYIINRDKEFYAVKNISLIFEEAGFVSIVGKSGSGKSTIMNLIGCIDTPTSGEIYVDDRLIETFRKKAKEQYFKSKVGMLFQSYNLIEDETVLFNVMLPLLINGEKMSNASKQARDLLQEVQISEKLFNNRVASLSGGEKQRVALARTLINSPEVILCDEPTGALDIKTSKQVMDILKKYAEKHLVIMVSHNLQLVNEYSDRIIEISQGKIKSDRYINKNKYTLSNKRKKIGCSRSWINILSLSNFKKRFKRNLFSFICFSISLTSSLLALGFINGKDKAIDKACLKEFDYGVGTIAKEEKISSSSFLSLTRSVRPDFEELQNKEKLSDNFIICPNFDYFLPAKINISYDSLNIDGLSYNPIYSFMEEHVNKALLTVGQFPSLDNLSESVINRSAYELLKEKMGKDPLNERLDITYHQLINFVDEDGTNIVDDFYFNKAVKIVGVVDELNYLNIPKIYYSYLAFENFTIDYPLGNISQYFNEQINLYSKVLYDEGFSVFTSYSYRLFPKNINILSKIADISFDEGLVFTSSSLLIRESLINFMEVAKYGLILFLSITIIGTILILGIMSYTSYSDDHKSSAILTCLGAKRKEISDIYLAENTLINLSSTIFSFLLSCGLSFLLNAIISSFIEIENVIVIPFSSLMGVPLFLIIAVLILVLLITLLVTNVPILFSKKINLKEELQSL